jgi:hypothetical protein
MRNLCEYMCIVDEQNVDCLLFKAVIEYTTLPNGAGGCSPMQNAFGFFLFRSSGFESYSDPRDPDPLPSSWPSGSMFESLERGKKNR